MKKLVFASVMALASLSLFYTPMLRAQDSNHHQGSGRVQHLSKTPLRRPIPRPKPRRLESFLTAYPQSVVKKRVLDTLIDIYSGLGDDANTLSAATRLLQVDPNNMKAIFYLGPYQEEPVRQDQRLRRPATMPRCWPARAFWRPSLPAWPMPTGRS